MRAEVRCLGLAQSEELGDYALKRLHLQLSRFGSEISSVVVRLKEVERPRGGLDNSCQIRLIGRRVGASVAELNADPRTAVDVAIERLSRTVAHALARDSQAAPAPTASSVTKGSTRWSVRHREAT